MFAKLTSKVISLSVKAGLYEGIYKYLVQKKCPLSVVGRVRYIEKYFKEFMKEKFRSVKICPLWASVRLSRVSVRTGFPVYFFINLFYCFLYSIPIKEKEYVPLNWIQEIMIMKL